MRPIPLKSKKSKTPKSKPKQIQLTELFQYDQDELTKGVEKQFNNAGKSEAEVGEPHMGPKRKDFKN